MPEACFSCVPDVPPGTANRHDLPRTPRVMGEMGPCFSYSAGALSGDVRRMPEGSGCFSYPTGGSCFSYSSGAPRAARDLPRTRSGGGVMGPCFSMSADLALGGLRRMPVGPCFTYAGSRTTRPGFTGATCFRY